MYFGLTNVEYDFGFPVCLYRATIESSNRLSVDGNNRIMETTVAPSVLKYSMSCSISCTI